MAYVKSALNHDRVIYENFEKVLEKTLKLLNGVKLETTKSIAYVQPGLHSRNTIGSFDRSN